MLSTMLKRRDTLNQISFEIAMEYLVCGVDHMDDDNKHKKARLDLNAALSVLLLCHSDLLDLYTNDLS